MPQVVHALDCGGRLAYSVAVAVLASTAFGYVFGAALLHFLRRGGTTTVETAPKSDGRKQPNSE